MEDDFDPPPGQPDPPFGEEATSPIGWILSGVFLAGVVGLVAHYLGWL
jgi:hypothetical protein